MGTRYVWERHSVTTEYSDEITEYKYIFVSIFDGLSVGTGYKAEGDNYNLIDESNSLAIAGQGHAEIGYPATTWKCAQRDYARHIVYEAKDPKPTDRWWIKNASSDGMWLFLGGPIEGNDEPFSSDSVIKSILRKGEEAAGELVGYSSSSSQSRYPSDGISNSYWYKYLGSDDIDPTSVSYSKQNVEAGDSITISAAPRAPVYGGTVYYMFSYSLDGGSTWENIGSRTTTPSVSFTVPALANKFQARVVASDNLGFTSSTYVYGKNFVLNEAPSAPASISVPQDVYDGSSFVISWAPSEDPDGNLYGYELERSYDGGLTWSSVSTNIQGTSTTDVIDGTHTSVQYRVRARDTHGLVSAWTYSSGSSIGKIKAYAAVSGVSRAGVKMYATVNGKIREIQKGYATVGGKIRKLF